MHLTSGTGYREAAKHAGFDPENITDFNSKFMYIAEDSQTAFRELLPSSEYVQCTLKRWSYPKQQFDAALDHRDALMVGSPQQIIEKMLYQYEMYGHQRFLGEIDVGGITMDQIKKNIELLATEIVPAVKKYTAKK